jgi:LysM repeat protein
MVGATLIVGVLIAAAVIGATSSPPAPDLTSPAAMALATRSLPPSWTVRPGDTFDSVAAANHLTTAQLQQLNPIQDPTNLVAGQQLRLHVTEPGTPQAPRRAVPAFWTVKRGDTYSSISAKTGVAIGDLASLNPKADPNLLHAGQRLRLRP